MTTSMYCLYVGVDYTYIDVNALAQGIKSFLACIYVCMYACMCMHVCMYVCMYVYACMYVCMHACMYVYVCMYVCMHVYMYVCMYACMCTYIERHTHILTDIYRISLKQTGVISKILFNVLHMHIFIIVFIIYYFVFSIYYCLVFSFDANLAMMRILRCFFVFFVVVFLATMLMT